MDIAVYTLTSTLHDEAAVGRISSEFLDSVLPGGGYSFRGGDFSDFGTHSLELIFVRTGGTEGIFKALMDEGRFAGTEQFHLLTSGKSNSLAASMEILSYLRQRGISGEIIHGSPEYVEARISELSAERVKAPAIDPPSPDPDIHVQAGQVLRIGVIGRPSDWLISSDADYAAVRERLGIELVDVPMSELLERLEAMPETVDAPAWSPSNEPEPKVEAAIPGADRIYIALKSIIGQYHLGGVTIRCFDLLGTVHNTGCLALARLNAEGFPAGCEGDVPAVLSLAVAHRATGHSGFQANPSRIDPQTGEILFAHCTVPLDIVESYEFDTHYESGIGVGVRGRLPEGPVTVFKLSGDLGRCFIAEGELLRNQAENDLCRTQVILRLPPEHSRYFLENPIGNHHIIIPGRHAEELKRYLSMD